ncbi:MAG: SGNH/GDSL hydrolase family protein [Clostridia bacterium]|nr:SGNH/GDSL hydrolase family protein [Clostridia bacterium]
MELKGKKINFLGDSITEGACLTDWQNVYWMQVGRETGAIVRGYGIGGTRIAPRIAPERPGEERFSQYFGSRIAEMDPDADIIVVFGGTNDFGHGDVPLGTMDDRDNGTFYGALHRLYRDLWEKYPAATIVVMTPLHRVGEHDTINEHGHPVIAPFKRIAEVIKEVAAYYSFPVLDLYAVSNLSPELPVIKEAFMPDGLHPNDAGHARIASRLVGFLKSL